LDVNGNVVSTGPITVDVWALVKTVNGEAAENSNPYTYIHELAKPTDITLDSFLENVIFDFQTQVTTCHFTKKIDFLTTSSYQIIWDRAQDSEFKFSNFIKMRRNIAQHNNNYITSGTPNTNKMSLMIRHKIDGPHDGPRIERRNYWITINLRSLELYKGGLNLLWYTRPEYVSAFDA
jgi:hypothetical protein